jgi:hypothetical protein
MRASVWNADHLLRGTLKRIARDARAEIAAVFPQGVHHRLRHSYILSKFCRWIDLAIATREEKRVFGERPGWTSTRQATHRHRFGDPPRRLQLKAKIATERDTAYRL